MYEWLKVNLRKLRCLQVIGKLKMASAETWSLTGGMRQNQVTEVFFVLLEISLDYITGGKKRGIRMAN